MVEWKEHVIDRGNLWQGKPRSLFLRSNSIRSLRLYAAVGIAGQIDQMWSREIHYNLAVKFSSKMR
jgi:hypothetical protein